MDFLFDEVMGISEKKCFSCKIALVSSSPLYDRGCVCFVLLQFYFLFLGEEGGLMKYHIYKRILQNFCMFSLSIAFSQLKIIS